MSSPIDERVRALAHKAAKAHKHNQYAGTARFAVRQTCICLSRDLYPPKFRCPVHNRLPHGISAYNLEEK